MKTTGWETIQKWPSFVRIRELRLGHLKAS